jgi:hypothetical protein
MRNITRTTLRLASMVLSSLGTVANATVSEAVTVKVPFPLMVNGQQVPAGRYTPREGEASTL